MQYTSWAITNKDLSYDLIMFIINMQKGYIKLLKVFDEFTVYIAVANTEF